MASSPEPPIGAMTREPPPDFGRHNMLAFGRDAMFLSHLPMFMAPHDAQLLLEVALEKDGGDRADAWSAERANHPDERFYTVMPEKFALSTLYIPDPPERTAFRATFFRGHLERGGEPLAELSDVSIRTNRVVYARRFDNEGRLEGLTYLLFGRGDEFFLAHVISAPPDFDQILSVRLPDWRPDDDDLQAGVRIELEGRANTAETRLRSGESTTARGHVTGAHQFVSVAIGDVSELYFEEGELSMSRGAFEPTELESEAGFGD